MSFNNIVLIMSAMLYALALISILNYGSNHQLNTELDIDMSMGIVFIIFLFWLKNGPVYISILIVYIIITIDIFKNLVDIFQIFIHTHTRNYYVHISIFHEFIDISYKLCIKQILLMIIISIIYGWIGFVIRISNSELYLILICVSALMFGCHYWYLMRRSYKKMTKNNVILTDTIKHLVHKSITKAISIFAVILAGSISVTDFLGDNLIKLNTLNNVIVFIFSIVYVSFLLCVSLFLSELEFNSYVYHRNKYMFNQGISNMFTPRTVIVWDTILGK